ncbi:MAG: hypothetical protein RR533_09585 [Carnobacterium sp.]
MIKVKDKKQNKVEKSTLSKKGLTSMLDLFPYKRIEDGFVVDKVEKYQAYLKIGTRNVYALSGSEQQQIMDHLTTLVRVYAEDISIISLMFPAGTEEQQVFWRRHLMQARRRKNRAQIQSCTEQIGRMLWIEQNLSNLEFYWIVYGDTKKELSEKIRDIKRNGGMNLNLEDTSPEIMEQIIFKLNNMNTGI